MDIKPDIVHSCHEILIQPGLAWRPQPKSGYQAVPAWLSLIPAARRVPLRGARRESRRVIRSAPNAAMGQARTA